MLVKIKADLSEEELAEAETKIENLKALQAQLTADFEARLSAAETEAKTFIENARKAREEGKSAN
jgi:F0F1-type ATP synthase membrane subunit b/b'